METNKLFFMLPPDIIEQIISYLSLLDDKLNFLENIVTDRKSFYYYIKNNSNDVNIKNISSCHHFARNNCIKLLIFAKQNKKKFTWNSAYTCRVAAENNHINILKWCKNQLPFHWDFTICASAASKGNIEVLEWLRKNGCPWDSSACASAALNGHFNTLKWLKNNGCPWNRNTCINAAKYGDLEILKWCRSYKPPCPWDVETPNAAAKNGHREILKWCRTQGCPWNKHVDNNIITYCRGKI